MSNPSARLRQTFVNTATMERINVDAQSNVDYGELVVERVLEWATQPGTEKHMLLGVDIGAFANRREESECFLKIRDLDIGQEFVNFGGKYDKYSSVLLTKST